MKIYILCNRWKLRVLSIKIYKRNIWYYFSEDEVKNEKEVFVKTFSGTIRKMWEIYQVQKFDYRSTTSKTKSLKVIKFRLIGQIWPFHSNCISWSLNWIPYCNDSFVSFTFLKEHILFLSFYIMLFLLSILIELPY